MNEFEKAKENGKKDIGQDVITDLAEHDPNADKELQPAPPNLGERIRKALKNMKQAGPRPKKELAKDRTRSLVLLIGGSVGAVLLFLGVFSTPTLPPAQSTSGRAVPNLVTGVSQPLTPKGSVTPLLNADVAANAGNAEQVTPADIQGTSRRPPPDDITHPVETRSGARVNHVPSLPGRNPGEAGSLSSTGPDPLAAYRLNNNAGTPTYSYGGAAAGAELSRTYAFGGAIPTLADTRTDAPVSAKSSIVFIRSSEPAGAAAGTRPAATAPFEEPSFLPPGTRLVARLETAAATGLKTPVVASIEYNYERDGMIMVPAGTRAFGEIQRASAEGYLNVQFHTLRMPNGQEEKIEASAVSLDHKPLKGQVSGKNTGKRLLSRTLSGVGTVAAYVVGASGAGLTRAVTGETLLRDRLASNVALAGEQELANAAYAQNITVTLLANTRFYVVLQKSAVAVAPTPAAEPARQSVEMPTVQELRELMDLRREINRMYQESNNGLRGGKP
jgi:Bacterial conjugation TrbI-like protein